MNRSMKLYWKIFANDLAVFIVFVLDTMDYQLTHLYNKGSSETFVTFRSIHLTTNNEHIAKN